MFRKTVENFTCERCGTIVSGSGYTNHCPQCLWSKHVDISPGDRLAECGGMMKPLRLEQEKGEFILTHRCEVCGHEKRNKVSDRDNIDEAIRVTKKSN